MVGGVVGGWVRCARRRASLGIVRRRRPQEHILWRDYTWHTQQDFQDALLKAWKDVGDDRKFIKKIMASVDRRSKDGDQGRRIAQLLASKGDQTSY